MGILVLAESGYLSLVSITKANSCHDRPDSHLLLSIHICIHHVKRNAFRLYRFVFKTGNGGNRSFSMANNSATVNLNYFPCRTFVGQTGNVYFVTHRLLPSFTGYL